MPLLSNYTQDIQEGSMWCWAAVAVCIVRNLNPQSSHTQCTLVQSVTSCRKCCSSSPPPPSCDVAGKLEDAFHVTGNLRPPVTPPATWNRLDKEMQNGNPVGVLLTLTGGGLHYWAVTGTRTPERLQVEDPGQGRLGFMSHRALRGSFVHQWVETVYAQP